MAKKINWWSLGFYSLGSIAVGGIGGVFTADAVKTWYFYLDKPFFSPPSWVFGPVWTFLFLLIGLSFYFVNLYGAKSKLLPKAQTYFYIQFVLNVLWSFVFFGMKLPWLAFLELLLMWYFIFMTIKLFSKIYKPSAWLLYPYIAWVSFAAILNLAVAWLN